MDSEEIRRTLPAIGRLLEDPALAGCFAAYGRALVADLVRDEVDRARGAIAAGRSPAPMDAASIAARVGAAAEALLAPAPRRVVNATGVIAHTNLGRSILSSEAARRVAETASRYADLEYDLRKGSRGDRLAHVTPLLARLFPGFAATAVNNNAGAIFLALHALAKGREALVSRGELVEIGGSFRVPEIMAASGARMREVGTTNRTRPADYAEAVGPKTALLLKVHSSNFKIVGFAEEATVADLAPVARAAGVPLVVDWGSGDLVDLAPYGILDERPVAGLLADGADLVAFSADKLLGGPQAGIAVGRPDLVKRMRRDPLARALRLDRIRIAALRETLAAYLRGRATEEVPTLRMLALTAEEVGRRAEALARELTRAAPRLRASVVDGVSRSGGGSSPVGELPTRLVAVDDPSGGAARIERRLRRGDPPVIARIHEGRVLLDLRTVQPDEDATVVRRLVEAAGGAQTEG